MTQPANLLPLDSLNCDSFAKHLATKFSLETSDQAIEVKLAEAAEAKSSYLDPNGRKGFSILFQIPEGFEVAQGSYRMSHPEMGSFELFLVPVMPSETGPRVEAVFN